MRFPECAVMRIAALTLFLIGTAAVSLPAAAETPTCDAAIGWKNWEFAVEICDPDSGGSAAEKAHMLAERGWAEDQLNQRSEAAADYDRAVALDPGNAASHLMRGRSRLLHGALRDALADADDAIRIDPNAAAYRFRGSVLTKMEQFGAAIDDLDRAIDLDPANALGYGLRGSAYAEQGDKDRARADFDTAFKINPECKLTAIFTFKPAQPGAAGQIGEPTLGLDCPE